MKWALLTTLVLLFASCIYYPEMHVAENSYAGSLQLTEPCYDDLSIAMTQARTPASLAPAWTSYKGSQVPAFSATQVNVIYFSAQLPHSYKEGSNLEFHIHIAYPNNNAGNSRWYLTYSWANMGDIFPVALSADKVVISPATTDSHEYAELIASINGTGKKISSVLLCSIQRTGTHDDDTYPSEIYLVSGDFHFIKDSIGSRQIGAK